MAAGVHGRSGAVTAGATPSAVAAVTSFSYEESVDETETTAMGDTAKEFLGGLKDGSGQVDCNWQATDAGHTALLDALDAGGTVDLNLYPEGNTTGKAEYSGSVIVKNMSLSSSKDDLVSIGFQFRGFLTKGVVA